MPWTFPFKKRNTENLWTKCENCQHLVYIREVEARQQVCPECGWHFRIDFKQRIAYLLDKDSFVEHFADLESLDPLNFRAKKGYKEKLKQAVKTSGINDAAVVGEGTINGMPIVFCVIDPTFIMGAMGSVTGEKIARGAELARKKKLPYILISGSGGGARMEEGALSLMQMAKTSAAVGRLKRDGGLFVVVLTNATMGGSMASFASLGDIILAEPMALLGFTGPRVIQQTIKTELPEGFQKSEFLLKHGFIDRIVPRGEMRDYLAFLITFFTKTTAPAVAPVETATPTTPAAAPDESDLVVQNSPMPRANTETMRRDDLGLPNPSTAAVSSNGTGHSAAAASSEPKNGTAPHNAHDPGSNGHGHAHTSEAEAEAETEAAPPVEAVVAADPARHPEESQVP